MERMITADSGMRRPDRGSTVTLVHAAAAKRRTPDSLDPEKAIEGILLATRELQSRLHSYERVLLVGLDQVRSGARISDVVQTLPADDRRMGTEVDVTEVFEARRTLRRALVAGLLADGMSVEEIAATFRVPVDGVCAFAAEVAHHMD